MLFERELDVWRTNGLPEFSTMEDAGGKRLVTDRQFGIRVQNG